MERVFKGFMFYVYILFSAGKDKYYVGESADLEERLKSHKAGISPYTSIAKDWKLVYSEKYQTRTEAIRREKEIKKKKSRKHIEWLVNSRKTI
jgi:putative endonuclease